MAKSPGEGKGKKRKTEAKERVREGGSGREYAGAVGLQPLASDRNRSVNSSHWLSH